MFFFFHATATTEIYTLSLHDALPICTRVGKAYHRHMEALRVHVGGDPSLPQVELIDQAARLAILARICWGDAIRNGVIRKDGSLAPALDGFLKATRDQRAVLEILGLKRQAKELTLQKVLEQDKNDQEDDR